MIIWANQQPTDMRDARKMYVMWKQESKSGGDSGALFSAARQSHHRATSYP
ncbi:hypothetical protein SAMN05421863_107716 [Nitrosomonas communis]|uniref:Uncharacterized protein n=1 Tax=Nitrosomonas communis TaxID=44574 RepID=A0A1I4V825_9PROT|nr:hypothetical protein SAMN05421863_107716 [Nitrosomonas communis]